MDCRTENGATVNYQRNHQFQEKERKLLLILWKGKQKKIKSF